MKKVQCKKNERKSLGRRAPCMLIMCVGKRGKKDEARQTDRLSIRDRQRRQGVMDIVVAFLGCFRQKPEQIAASTCVSFSIPEDCLVQADSMRTPSFLKPELTTTLADGKVLFAPKRNPTPT